MKFVTKLACFIFAQSLTCISYAANLDVDHYLRTVDLTKLVNQNTVRNLSAQLIDPLATTDKVDDMTDFFAIAVNDASDTTLTEFDTLQTILKQSIVHQPWVGVGDYAQSDIPRTTLQEGLDLVKTCMAAKGHALSGQIHRVTVYKIVQNQQMIYDYIFQDASLPPNQCQEILFAPSIGDCQIGLKVNCHQKI